MGIIGGEIGYQLLRRVNRVSASSYCDGSAYVGKSKIEVLLGSNIWDELAGKVVIDFGCGTGEDSIEIAQRSAKQVIGLDIRQSVLDQAAQAAEKAGVSGKCRFTMSSEERADVILSVDAFEHFSDPAAVLKQMRRLVKDDGCVIAAFGPTWYHPLGGHLFSVFPWSHLVFTENALIRWRSDFKSDGATRFGEVEGGLNQMTIRRFEKLVSESDFRFERLETIPIRRLEGVANRLTREFTTAIVRCKLVPRSW
jgi:SAM-dependent methyltransferase